MKSVRAVVAALVVLFTVFIVAPALVGCGGGTEVKQSTSSYSTTLGQELQDLDAAYQKGLLTEKEYKEAKKKLIEQRTE
jgi:hypothetical protein